MADSGYIAKLWNWFDRSFLFWGVIFLALFIPLYPKIPLGEIIPGYIVRVRAEDFVVALLAVWWGVQALRRKVVWKTPLTLMIAAYVLVGLLSTLSAVYITKTIPAELLHVGKSLLHWLRYIEYFLLFFFAYAAVKTRRQAEWFFGAGLTALLGVVVYGYGQKYLYWPVYSTMNREFSKGIRLYLGEFGRVQSTFGGHYDLGAYLVIVLPLCLALFIWLGRNKPKSTSQTFSKLVRARWYLLRVLAMFAWFAGLWLLVLSASRASFIGYLAAMGLVIGLYMLRYRLWWWGVTRGVSILVISVLMMFLVGELPSRFGQLIDQNKHPQLHVAFHTVNDYINHPYKFLGLAAQQKPNNGISVADLEEQLNQQGLTVSDTQPTTTPPGSSASAKPSDVLVDVPDTVYALNDPAATTAGTLVQVGDKLVKERIYSDCSLERSLSLCIRLETLWPRAFRGFLSNPLFGSGYATLTKSSREQFTEAESTDNNFLRTLGETGGLGFLFFYGTIGLGMWYAIKTLRTSRDSLLVAVAIGLIATSVGLLLNALYIDVFAASKVAYMFWLFQGVALALFVREGLVSPQFAFEHQQQKQEAAQLSALLQSLEAKRGDTATAKKGTYVSSARRRAKNARPRRR